MNYRTSYHPIRIVTPEVAFVGVVPHVPQPPHHLQELRPHLPSLTTAVHLPKTEHFQLKKISQIKNCERLIQGCSSGTACRNTLPHSKSGQNKFLVPKDAQCIYVLKRMLQSVYFSLEFFLFSLVKLLTRNPTSKALIS